MTLFREMREAFDNDPHHYGLTYTIPTSYWYLRWFDVRALNEYADWTNVMSYDLHGVWDRNNSSKCGDPTRYYRKQAVQS